MSKTLSVIRTQVRSWLDEADAKAADWTNAELNILINAYYHQVYSEMVDVFEDYAPIETYEVDTTEDVQEYDLSLASPAILKLRRVEINYKTSDPNHPPERALPIKIDDVRRDLGFKNFGLSVVRGPQYYWIGNTIGFIPIPNETSTTGGAIKIWYPPQKSDMSSDSDTIDIPYADRDWMIIAYGATAEALRFGQQEEAAANTFDRKFQDGIERMKQQYEDRIAEEAKFVTDVTGNYREFSEYAIS